MAVKGLSLFLVLILFALLSHLRLAAAAAGEARLPLIPPVKTHRLLHLVSRGRSVGGEWRMAAGKKVTSGSGSRGGGAATNLRRGNGNGTGDAVAPVGASWRVAAAGLTLTHLFFLW